MPWMDILTAATSLGCSERTIRRRVAAGTLETRRNGKAYTYFVEGPAPVDTLSETAGRLAQVAVADAVTAAKTSDIMKTALEALADARQSLDQQLGHARMSIRWAWSAATTFLVGAALVGWAWHNSALDAVALQADADSRHAILQARVVEVDHARQEALRRAENAENRLSAFEADPMALMLAILDAPVPEPPK